MWCTRYLYGSKEGILKFKEECHKNNIPYREDGLVVIIDKEYKQKKPRFPGASFIVL